MNMNEQWEMPDENLAKDTKRRKKKEKMPKTSGASRSLTTGAVCLLIALLVFIVMLTIMKRELYSVPTTPVIVAQEDVPKGIVLDKTSIEKYFTIREEKTESLSAGYFSDALALVGKAVAISIPKNQIANAIYFTDDTEIDEIEDAVELAIEVPKLGQVVAGTIRPGDHIDIQLVYAIDKNSHFGVDNIDDWGEPSTQYEYDENWNQDNTLTVGDGDDGINGISDDRDESFFSQGYQDESLDDFGNVFHSLFSTLLTGYEDYKTSYSSDGKYAIETIAENILVSNAYNTAGEDSAVTAQNGTQLVASIITVVVPKSLQTELQMALERGTIRISKVLDSEARKEQADDSIIGETKAPILEDNEVSSAINEQESRTVVSTEEQDNSSVEVAPEEELAGSQEDREPEDETN